MVDYLDTTGEYWNFGNNFAIIATEPLALDNPDCQEILSDLINEYGAMEDSTDGSSSWFLTYLSYLRETRSPGPMPTGQEFYTILRDEFLVMPQFKPFAEDIKFAQEFEFEDAYYASRNFVNNVTVFGYHVAGARLTSVQMKAYDPARAPWNMVKAREIVDSYFSKVSPFVVNPDSSLGGHFYAFAYEVFIYNEADIVVVESTLQSLGIAIACVVIATLILIPYPLVALYMIVTIVTIDLGIVGFMSYWDLSLNTVTMVNLIMSVGFSVDFCAHIAHHFAASKITNLKDKTTETWASMAFPVLQAGLSTMLGTMFLAFSNSTIFVSFFRMMMLTLIFGMLFGLIFLPLSLSVVGVGASNKNPTVELVEFASQKSMEADPEVG